MQLLTMFCIISMTVEKYNATCMWTRLGALLSEFLPPTYVFSPQDEVNAIKWDPTGTLLASCSDDFTAKVNFAAHLVTLRSYILGVLSVFSNFQFSWKNSITIIVRKLWILRNVQIWSLKQDKCLHDLKDHSKVSAITWFSDWPKSQLLCGCMLDNDILPSQKYVQELFQIWLVNLLGRLSVEFKHSLLSYHITSGLQFWRFAL